jgi:protein-L-isoaspartate(D-aspartate) O-methyltransferase
VSRGLGPALLAIVVLLPAGPLAAWADSSPAQMLADLRARGIHDARVLDALGRVRREAFAPPAVQGRAYDDRPLAIGHGQTMSQPYVVALMTELLDLEGPERVLEIGTGSGYQAAVLAELVRDVYSVEIVPELATTARLRLVRLGYRNVHVKLGDGALGWRDYGPYDAIVVTAVARRVPPALIDQLTDGGILVMPVGDPNGRQVLVRGEKRGGKLRSREIAEVRFVPLVGEGAARPQPKPRITPRETPPDDAPRDGRGIIEENLPGPSDRDEESDTRHRLDARSRAARAPVVPGGDRRCAAARGVRADAGSPAVGRRCVA